MIALGFSIAAAAPIHASEATALAFSKGSYEIPATQVTELGRIAGVAKGNSALLITIHELTSSLKSTSISYITEKNRALRIFQELVRQGVDPAQIAYKPVKKSDGKVAVSAEVGSIPHSTPKIVPSDGAAGAGAHDFAINFPSASAEPVNLSAEGFQAFLASVGQPGRDAVVITGFTDSVGNAHYNQALGELRALSVYERLVRAGLPPYRVDTKSHGMSAAKKNGDSAEDRKVIVSWTSNATVAAQAQKEDAPPAPAPAPPAPPAPAPVAQELPPPSAAKDDGGSLFDLVPFFGLAAPQGELKNHAKNGTTFGLGVGKALITDPGQELRATLFASGKTKYAAKEADRDGPLTIQTVILRADYAYGAGAVRPFFGLALGAYRWEATIV